MKNTVKKGFLFEAKKLSILAVLALLVVGGVFAQRVGDIRQLDGRDYRVAEVRGDGSIVLQPVTSGLDGVWRGQTSGTIITISGDTAVYTTIGNNEVMRGALNREQIAVGGVAMQNLTRQSDTLWRGDVRTFSWTNQFPSGNVSANFTQNLSITVSADGRSFTVPASAGGLFSRVDHTYTRQ